MKIKLKSCPLCGQTKDLKLCGRVKKFYWIKCDSCDYETKGNWSLEALADE